MVYTVALLAVLVIYHGVAEVVYVAAGLPYRGVHKYGSIYAHNIFVHLRHTAPPVVADVLFELCAILSVVINGAQAIIYLARLEDKTIFLAMPYYILQLIVICHNAGKNRQNRLTVCGGSNMGTVDGVGGLSFCCTG